MSKTIAHEQLLDYSYAGKSIRYSLWHTDLSGGIKTVIFLGTVQIGKLPKWVAESCPSGTIVAQGAPHWHAKDDGSDIPAYMLGYTRSALQAIVDNYLIKTVNVIADSQATPSVLQLLGQDPYAQYLDKLVLLQPLGLNHTSFSGNHTARIAEFKKRILKNAYHQVPALLTDNRLRHNHRQLTKKVRFGDEKTRAQYDSGLLHNAIPDLKRIIEVNKKLHIICGENDEIFPASELKKTLLDNDIAVEVSVVKGVPHSPLGTRNGSLLLRAAFEYLNQ